MSKRRQTVRPRSGTSAQVLPLPLAAMVDIVFLLLVYFLITYRDEKPEALLAVQRAAVTETPAKVRTGLLELEVQAGRVLIQGVVRSFPEIRSALWMLAELDPDQCVIVRIHPDAQAAEVVRVLDACHGAGFANLNLAAVTP